MTAAVGRGGGPPFWLVALIGFLQSVLAYLMIVGVPLRIVQLGGSPAVVGLSFTAWAVGRAVTGYLGGRRYDRVGPRAVLVASFCLFGLAAALYGLGPTAWIVVLGRLAQGIGAGLYWAGILAAVGEAASGSARMRRLSAFSSMVALGGILGAVLGGWLMGGGGIIRLMVVAAGLAALLVLLAGVLPGRSRAGRTPSDAVGRSMATRSVGLLSVLGAVSQLPAVLANAGLPLLLLSVGLGARAIGVENALIVAGVLIGQGLLMRYAGRASALRMLPPVYAVAAGALGLLALGYTAWAVLVGLAVLGAAVQVLATLWVSTVQSAVAENHIGAATGFMRASSDVLTAACYPLVGVAVDFRTDAGVGLALLLGLLAAVVASRSMHAWYASVRRAAAPGIGRTLELDRQGTAR